MRSCRRHRLAVRDGSSQFYSAVWSKGRKQKGELLVSSIFNQFFFFFKSFFISVKSQTLVGTFFILKCWQYKSRIVSFQLAFSWPWPSVIGSECESKVEIVEITFGTVYFVFWEGYKNVDFLMYTLEGAWSHSNGILLQPAFWKYF